MFHSFLLPVTCSFYERSKDSEQIFIAKDTHFSCKINFENILKITSMREKIGFLYVCMCVSVCVGGVPIFLFSYFFKTCNGVCEWKRGGGGGGEGRTTTKGCQEGAMIK